MIVGCDTFSYEDYPIYCASAAECVEEFHAISRGEMSRVMEVYDFKINFEDQLLEPLAWHLPPKRDPPPNLAAGGPDDRWSAKH